MSNELRFPTQTLKTLVGLEEVNQPRRAQLLGVFGSNLNDNLQILANVVGKHLLEAFNGLINRKSAEEVHNPLGVEQVGMHNRSLYVVNISVMLESLSEKRVNYMLTTC
jgi:hypothetical protein